MQVGISHFASPYVILLKKLHWKLLHKHIVTSFLVLMLCLK